MGRQRLHLNFFQLGGSFPFNPNGPPSTAQYVYCFTALSLTTLLFILDCVFVFIPETFGINDWAIEFCNIVEIAAYIGIVVTHMQSVFMRNSSFEQLWKQVPLTWYFSEVTILISSVMSCIDDSIIYYVSGIFSGLPRIYDLTVFIITVMLVSLIQSQFVAALEELAIQFGLAKNRISQLESKSTERVFSQSMVKCGQTSIVLHSDFLTISELAADVYGWQIMFSILLVATCIVRLGFDLHNCLMREGHELAELVCTFINLILKLVQLLILVHVCEKCSEQVIY